VADDEGVIEDELDELALELILSASRFTRRAGRVPGTTHSATTWQTLSELDVRGGLRVSDLAQLQHVAQPTMTSIVQRFEQDGWVSRAPDPEDGRATLIRITDLGRSELRAYRRGAVRRTRPLLAELTGSERELLARAAELLGRLAKRADP